MNSPSKLMRATLLGLCLSLGLIAGCQKAAAPAPEKAADSAPKEESEGLALSAEDVQKLGVQTMPAAAASWTPETAGFGVVLSHEMVAQPVADVASAQAAVHQSRAALARIKQLADSPGALGVEARESAERQAGIDEAALTLAERRLSAALGTLPDSVSGAGADSLTALAGGQVKLVRVTFPLGAEGLAHPHAVRLLRLSAALTDHRLSSNALWPAPADSSVPGRSFFATIAASDLSEGERLQAWVPYGAEVHGVLIPAGAIVQSEGKYWCYLRNESGNFVRTEVDATRPVTDGYFVTEGVEVGAPIVTSAAGLLLARESNPSTEAD